MQIKGIICYLLRLIPFLLLLIYVSALHKSSGSARVLAVLFFVEAILFLSCVLDEILGRYYERSEIFYIDRFFRFVPFRTWVWIYAFELLLSLGAVIFSLKGLTNRIVPVAVCIFELLLQGLIWVVYIRFLVF